MKTMLPKQNPNLLPFGALQLGQRFTISIMGMVKHIAVKCGKSFARETAGGSYLAMTTWEEVEKIK
jgi:hypothetical protein